MSKKTRIESWDAFEKAEASSLGYLRPGLKEIRNTAVKGVRILKNIVFKENMKLAIRAISMLVWVMCLGLGSAWAESRTMETKPSSNVSVAVFSDSESSDSELTITPPSERALIRGRSRQVQNCFTLEPIGIIVNMATLEYERMMGFNTSFAVGFKFTGPSSRVTFDESGFGWNHTALGIQGALRFYPLKSFYAPRGLWFGPTVEYVNDYFNEFDASVRYINALAEVGFTFVFNDRLGFVVSPFIGVGYSWSKGDPIYTETGRLLAPHAGFTGVFGCRIGLGF